MPVLVFGTLVALFRHRECICSQDGRQMLLLDHHDQSGCVYTSGLSQSSLGTWLGFVTSDRQGYVLSCCYVALAEEPPDIMV